jgi:hypothetical protein
VTSLLLQSILVLKNEIEAGEWDFIMVVRWCFSQLNCRSRNSTQVTAVVFCCIAMQQSVEGGVSYKLVEGTVDGGLAE